METRHRQIQIYQNKQGKEPFVEWISRLTRQNRARILASGNDNGNLIHFANAKLIHLLVYHQTIQSRSQWFFMSNNNYDAYAAAFA